MRALSILLVIALAIAAAFSAGSLDRRLAISTDIHRPLTDAASPTRLSLPVEQPVTLRLGQAEHVRMSIHTFGADHVTLLRISARGTPLSVVVDREARTQHLRCVPTIDTDASCKVALRLAGSRPATVLIAPEAGTAVIDSLEIEPVTAKRHTGASGAEIFAGFIVLLLLGPLLVRLQRHRAASELSLIAGGFLWIALAGWIGWVVALGFAAAGYGAIRVAELTSGRRAGLVASALAIIGMLVLVVKFAAPVLAASFANPGGFWLALPLGLSYLAIRIVDLILAAHTRTLDDFSPRTYLAFLFSPYTLPAGPIQLYSEFLRSRLPTYSIVDFSAGAGRVMVGIAKKHLADSILLPVVIKNTDAFLAGGADSDQAAVTMLFTNLLYVYLDFSAYCDLAIGAARAGGRRLPENFDWPLIRGSVREYWRHWHMTLSRWVMRRVYFPAFLASRSVALSMFASMLVIGLWHAPTISWALWAAHHSAMMTLDARLSRPVHHGAAAAPARSGLPKRIGGTLLMLSWVSLGHSFTIFASPAVALQSYFTALTYPLQLVRGLFPA